MGGRLISKLFIFLLDVTSTCASLSDKNLFERNTRRNNNSNAFYSWVYLCLSEYFFYIYYYISIYSSIIYLIYISEIQRFTFEIYFIGEEKKMQNVLGTSAIYDTRRRRVSFANFAFADDIRFTMT